MGVRQQDELISVIVPAYNAAATIGGTLESALAQTYQNLEILVADDGSTDDTADIVTRLAACDARVHLLQQANAGVAAARNLAIARARGAYVAPLDADDLWHPEKLEAQLAVIRRGGSRIGVVYCWWRRIDMRSLVFQEEWHPYPHEGDVYAALVMGNILGCSSSPLIRKRHLADVGGYNTDARIQGCEDLQLYLRLAERCDFALVPRLLVGYRMTPGSVSSDARRMLRAQKLVLAGARRRRPDLPARLFRLAEARSEYQRGKACLRHGPRGPGVMLLLNAVLQDPMGAMHRIVEPLHRLGLTPSSQLHAKGPRLERKTPRPLARVLAAGGLTKGSSARDESDRIVGRPFLSVSPEPRPGARLGSTLYAWRCNTIAASLAGRTDHALRLQPRGRPAGHGSDEPDEVMSSRERS